MERFSNSLRFPASSASTSSINLLVLSPTSPTSSPEVRSGKCAKCRNPKSLRKFLRRPDFGMTMMWNEKVGHSLKSIRAYLAVTTVDRYIKISLFSAAIYASCILMLVVINGILFSLMDALPAWQFDTCGLPWTSASPPPSFCMYAIEFYDTYVVSLVFIIAGLAYAVAVPTGLFAAYRAIMTHHKWWTAITIYAVVQNITLLSTPFS